MTDDPYLTEKIEKLEKENLAHADEVKEQKLKFNDMLRERNRYIDEIKELKLRLASSIATCETCHYITELKEYCDEQKLKLKQSLLKSKVSSKKICPFMSQTTVTACRKDCQAHTSSYNPPCAIMAAHYATAQEWSYKE